MPAPGGVDEHHIVPLLRGKGHGVLGHRRSILAIALLVQLDLAALAGGQLFEVAHVHGQLLDGAGAEGVARCDEHLVLVLQEEEADLREIGGFADAVDTDNGHDVGAALAEGGSRRGGDGVDLAEEVEGGGRGKHFRERGFHGLLYPRIDAWDVVSGEDQ